MLRSKRAHVAACLGRSVNATRLRVALVLLGAALVTLVYVLLLSRSELDTRVHAAGAPDHTLLLPAAEREHWTVSGHVQDDHGAAVAGARVCAVRAVGDATQQSPSCTDSEVNGAYALELSDRRPVMVTASAAGHALGHARSGLPIRADDASRGDADIVLHGDGARIAGSVVDAYGKPVGDARVRLFRMLGALQTSVETRTDALGNFELWAAAGGVTIRFEAAGYVPASRWVVAPSQRVALQLTPASSISGSVVDESSGKPVAGVEVRALFEGKRGRSAAAVSGDDGQFTLSGLEAGRYVITAEHERFRARDVLATQVAVAENQKSLNVPLQPAVSVFGKVVSTEGEPCVGGRVSLDLSEVSQLRAASQRVTLAQVELDGTLRLRGLAPGRYRVAVHCPEQVLAEGPRLLEIHDQDVHETWRVEPGVGLDITVLDAADKTVPRAAVVLRRALADHPEQAVVTPMTADDAGHVNTGTHLLPGKYTVKPSAGLQGEPVTVDLQAGAGRVERTLRLRGSAWIDVDVQDNHGHPVDDLRVVARAAAHRKDVVAELLPATPQGDGGYRIGPLEAGSYILDAADGVNRSWSDAMITLADNAAVRSKLVIERDGRLAGRVLDAGGQPAANVWVNIKDEGATLDPRRAPKHSDAAQRRLTDANGQFEIAGLSQGGRFVVSVSGAEAGNGEIRDVRPGTAVRLALAQPTPIASSASDR